MEHRLGRRPHLGLCTRHHLCRWQLQRLLRVDRLQHPGRQHHHHQSGHDQSGHHPSQGSRDPRPRCTRRPTVLDSTFTALDPGTPQQQEALYAYQPSALVVENNRFTDGHAVLVNGNTLSTSPLRISRNDFINTGRYNQPVCCLGAIHFDKVSAPNGASLSWNKSTATYGQSLNEDVLGIYQSNGASGNPIMIDHNLINGSYPLSGDGADFTGTCINIGDDFGTWQTGDTNTGVNCTNIGLSIAFETTGSNLTQTNSTTVTDGLAGINDSGPRVSSSFGNGINSAGGLAGGNIVITNNQSGQRRWNGTAWESADYYIPDATTATGNTSISPVNAAAEQAAVDAWEAARVAAGVTIGPR